MRQVTNILCYFEDELDTAFLARAAKVAESVCASLTLAAVVEPAGSHARFKIRGFDLDEIERLLVEDRQRRLVEAANLVRSPSVEVATRVFVGKPAQVLITAVQEEGFDLVAKPPSPKQGLRQQLFGSIDMHLMRTCPCPVLIGRPKTDGYSGRAVAAVSYDADDEKHAHLNHEILELAAFVAKTQFAAINEVHVVHAWTLYGESLLAHGRGKVPRDELKEALKQEEEHRERWLTDLVKGFLSRTPSAVDSGFKPKVALLRGDPTIVIPNFIRKLNADLLAMGMMSQKGLHGRLIGNTAEEILNRVSCSVAVHKLA